MELSEGIVKAHELDQNKGTETGKERWQEEVKEEEGAGDFNKTWSLSLNLSSGIQT